MLPLGGPVVEECHGESVNFRAVGIRVQGIISRDFQNGHFRYKKTQSTVHSGFDFQAQVSEITPD